MNDLVLFIISMLVLSALVVDAIRLRIHNKNVFSALVQSEIDRKALGEKLKEVWGTKDQDSVEQTDGFLKFVSESRDWAFGYIEDVQKDLEDLKTIFEKTGSYPTNVADADELSAKINKVISHLPEDNISNN